MHGRSIAGAICMHWPVATSDSLWHPSTQHPSGGIVVIRSHTVTSAPGIMFCLTAGCSQLIKCELNGTNFPLFVAIASCVPVVFQCAVVFMGYAPGCLR